MPKIPPLSSQQIIKILKKKGFVLDRSKGSHRIFYHPESKKRVIVPFHKRDLPKGTMMEILRQAGIEREELLSLL
jgi:predicted RNA binding protein YcfA (HicA-like mRNA interferase family)